MTKVILIASHAALAGIIAYGAWVLHTNDELREKVDKQEAVIAQIQAQQAANELARAEVVRHIEAERTRIRPVEEALNASTDSSPIDRAVFERLRAAGFVAPDAE